MKTGEELIILTCSLILFVAAIAIAPHDAAAPANAAECGFGLASLFVLGIGIFLKLK